MFGYESPNDARSNLGAGDAESSNAVWIRAHDEKEALAKGHGFAEAFVARLYSDDGAQSSPSWRAGDFAHWIAKRPLEEFSGLALDTFDEI